MALAAKQFVLYSLIFYVFPKLSAFYIPAGWWCLHLRAVDRKAARGEIELPQMRDPNEPTSWDLALENLRSASGV